MSETIIEQQENGTEELKWKEQERDQECVGCKETKNLEHCNGTMCHKCWLQETIDEE